MTLAAYGLLAVALVLFAVRLWRGPTLSDRVVALDGMLLTGGSMILVNAADTGDGSFLMVAVMLTLVGFISTAVIARFIEGRSP